VILLALPLAAALPTWPSMTTSELAKFDAGDLVLRADTSTPLTVSTGIVKVAAPPSLLWREALDFEAKKPENPTIKTLEEYARNSPDDWFVRFELSVFGIQVVIHDHWTCFPEAMTCTWVQDPAKKSDVREEAGYLIVRPEPTGSAIVFHSQFISEVWSPGWVRRWLANDSMVNVVDKLRKRTERKAG
jgi:hypothetical protein